MHFQFELSNLNPPHRKAVEHTEGPLLILAGAGSGKTRVITYRIAHLIHNRGISPAHILAVTFTNKAAEEMKERIRKLDSNEEAAGNRFEVRSKKSEVRNQMDGLWIGTFHSICLRLLRRYGQVIGYRNDFSVYDKSDQLGVVRECVKELNINDELYPVNSIARRISYLKRRLITPQESAQKAHDFGADARVLAAYRLYQDKLTKNNAMDFDDLIMRCVELLKKDSEILNRYQEMFKYILVDEYQDTNPSQYSLIRLLSDRHRNLCVVGDDDQSIYRFRGAELQNILSFEKDYPSAMVIRLEQNYRSTASILNVAGMVIEKNIGRREKRLWTERPDGDPVVYHRTADEREEANYVVRCVRSMIKEGRRPDHFAILYRTNAQSRVIEEALQESTIPYVIIGGIRFYERREVKDILAYIKVSISPDDDRMLRRIINVPHRGIGAMTMKGLEDQSGGHGVSLYEGAVTMSPANPRIGGFVAIIEKLKILVRELSPSEFVKGIFEVTGYIEALKMEEGAEDRIDNVMELLGAIKRYEERRPGMGIDGFLDEVSLLSDIDESANSEGQNSRVVSLMTLHSAKGLEFPVVFITGLEEGILPHGRALESEEEIEEERRLCYVGITRARERLYLTSAGMRNIFGQSQSKRESRFLREIKKDPKLMIEISNREMYNKTPDNKRIVAGKDAWGRFEIAYNQRYQTSDRSYVTDRGEDRQFKAGDRVRHLTWGPGIVESSEGRGDQEKVVVRFNSGGSKTLAVKFANLEML